MTTFLKFYLMAICTLDMMVTVLTGGRPGQKAEYRDDLYGFLNCQRTKKKILGWQV